MRKLFYTLMLFFAALSFNLQAQPGTLDATFNATDLGRGFGDGTNNFVNASVVQSDGKVIIGGSFTTYNGISRLMIARLNADGSLDETYSAIASGPNSQVGAMAIQSDGKVIISGTFTTFSGTPVSGLARVNTNGTLDATFNAGTGANSSIVSIAIQSNGKIILGGIFTSYNGTARNRIARINADGTIDATFNPGTGADGNIAAVAIQGDGKIMIGGTFLNYNATSCKYLARLNTDGSLDGTFTGGTGADNYVSTILIQSDGKKIVTGAFLNYNGTARARMARLDVDGALDATFNPGTGYDNFIFSTTLQSDGKIIIGGNFTTYNGTARNCVARLNDDGTLDATFIVGTGASAHVLTTAVLSTGKVIIGGQFVSFNGYARTYITQLNSDGSFDTAYNIGTGANSTVYATRIQSDGKIVIGGDFNFYNGTASSRIVRLNDDGTIDATFVVGTGANAVIRAIAIQSDGKILIGGDFTSYNGTSINRIARLNTDGTIDVTFTPGSGANLSIYAIAVRSSDSIFIGGDFTNYNGTSINRIARLKVDGTLDATFTPGTGVFGGPVRSISIQGDGKTILGGAFSTYNGTSRRSITRINVDGTLDATFVVGTGTVSVGTAIYATAIQSDGKIIIVGDYTSYNGTARNRIARLNTDGSLDAAFNPGTGANTMVYATAIQSDGKIIIGGSLTMYNGTSNNRLVRVNTDGSLDGTFKVGNGPSATVYALSLQSDRKIIVGGNFTVYQFTGRNRICRVLNPLVPDINVKGNGVTIVDGDATPSTLDDTDFGSVLYGSNTTKTFTIENLDLGTMNITLPLTKGGTNSSDFTFTVPPAATLAPGGTTTFTVQFTPGAAGVRTASLYIVSDDPDEITYDFAVTGTGTKLDQAITFNALADKTYGDASFTVSATGGASGNGIYFTSSNTAVATCSGTLGETITIVGAGPCTIYANQAGNTNYNAAPEVSQSFTVNKAALTVTANNKSRSYGAANPTFDATFTGFVYAQSLATSDVTGSAGLTCTATSTSPAGTPVTITSALGSLSSTNYSFTFVDGALTITKAELTVTADAKSKVYGAANPALTGLITGMVNSESVATACSGTAAYSCAATTSSPAGTPVAIIPTLGTLTSTNYSFTFVNGALTITKAELTVTADAKSKVYGTANPALTGLITGMVNSESVATACSGTAAYSCAATTSSPAGTPVAIIPALGTLTSTNYSFTFVNGALTITKAELTVTADAKSKVYGAANPALTGLITGMVNSESVATACSGTAAYSCAATTSSPAGIPVAIIPALGTLTSTNYSFTFVNGALTITKAELTVTGAVASNKPYDGNTNASITGATLVGVVGTDDVTLGNATTGTFATSAAGVGINVVTAMTITGLASGNYTLTQPTLSADIIGITLTVTGAVAASKPYDGNTNASISGGVLNGVVGLDDVVLATATTGTFASANVGSNISVTSAMTLSGADASKYSLTQPTLTATITAITLTVTADNQTKVYGEANPALTYSYSGFVNGEDKADITEPTISTIANSTSNVGEYDIVFSGGSATNYTITPVNGKLTVTKANQVITFNALDTVKIGDAAFNLSATSTSGLPVLFASSDITIAKIDGNTVSIIKEGNVNITASEPGNSNYNAAVSVVQPLVIIKGTRNIISNLNNCVPYPNPTSGKVTIDLDKGIVSLYSLDGKILMQTSMNTNKTIDLSNQPAGMYILLIKTENGNKEFKIIKE